MSTVRTASSLHLTSCSAHSRRSVFSGSGGSLFTHFCIVFAYVLVLYYLLLPVSASATTTAHNTVLSEQRPLRVVHAENMAPLSWRGEDGAPKGLIIDYWNKWSETTGVPVHFTLLPWKKIIPHLLSGAADIHGGLFYSQQRELSLDFGVSTYLLEGAIMVRRDVVVSTPDELTHVPVGVLSEGFSEYYMKTRYPHLTLVPFDSVHEMAEAAASGKIIAMLADMVTLQYQLKANEQLENFTILVTPYTRPLHVAAPKGNVPLLTTVNQGMQNISGGEREILFQRWIPSSPVPSVSSVLILFLLVVALLCTASCFQLISLNRRLRQTQEETANWEQQNGLLPAQTQKTPALLVNHPLLQKHHMRLAPHSHLPDNAQFAKVLESIWETARKAQQPVSLLLLNIPKEISLSAECLYSIVRALTHCLTVDSDLPAHIAPHTFACLLSNTDHTEAATVASCLQMGLADLPCLTTVLPVQAVSIGFGTLIPQTDTSTSELFDLAYKNIHKKQHTANIT